MSFQKNGSAVRRFAKLLKFSTWLQGIPNKITPPAFRLMQIGSAFWQSRTLYLATRLDIASKLGNETLLCEEIAARVSAHPETTFRLLRMLAAMDIFEETTPRHFRNNRISSLLRSDNPQNVRAIILMHNSEAMSRPWYEQLERGVKEDAVPFELTHGENLYNYMDSHPEFDKLFSQAMESVEGLTGDSFTTDFDWGRFERLIDVGGSRGSKSLAILRRHPRLKALVVDRAQVIAGAEDYWRQLEDPILVARLQFREGNAMESIPVSTSKKDIYLLSGVLHGFDDDDALQVLQNLATAIGDTGARAALLELVIADVKADFAGASFDMQMLMGTRGRERTLGDWQRLFEKSGLSLDEVVNLRTLWKIIVLRRGS